MSPDINSLSSSASPSQAPEQPTQNPTSLPSRSRMSGAQESLRHHSPGRTLGNGTVTPPILSHSPQANSLAAAAALNSGLQNEERNPAHGSLRGTSTFERRRSSVRMSLSLNDPSLPAPGEMAISPASAARIPSLPLHGHQSPPSPTRHARAPSLGELHQELEQEQEAQVVRRHSTPHMHLCNSRANLLNQNRLLSMIRQQQAQITALQSQQSANSNAIDDSNPPSDTSRSQTPALRGSIPRSSSRQNSNVFPSHSPSPSLRPQQPSMALNTSVPSGDEFSSIGPSSAVSNASWRDESAFYQAETQNLTRENQMLKQRIRELERQISEVDGPTAVAANSPVIQSSLHTAPVLEADNMNLPSAAGDV